MRVRKSRIRIRIKVMRASNPAFLKGTYGPILDCHPRLYPVLRIRIRDPESGAFLTSVSGIIPKTYKQFFWLKIPNPFTRILDPESF
jgi:hypothetical protein